MHFPGKPSCEHGARGHRSAELESDVDLWRDDAVRFVLLGRAYRRGVLLVVLAAINNVVSDGLPLFNCCGGWLRMRTVGPRVRRYERPLKLRGEFRRG